MEIISALWALLAIALLSRAIYNLYFHPLARLPGPKLWAAFRWPYVVSLWRGKLVHHVFALHQKYGDVVRVAPNEVSFANGQAWEDIYSHRKGHKLFPRNPIWYERVPGRAESVMNASTMRRHDRMREMLAPCFTSAALAEQEPVVQKQVSTLMQMLRRKLGGTGTTGTPTTTLKIVNWFQAATHDILHDLCFANDRSSALEDLWPKLTISRPTGLFSHSRMNALASTAGLYGRLSPLVKCLTPSSNATKEKHDANFHHVYFDAEYIERNKENTPQYCFTSKLIPHTDKSKTSDEAENDEELGKMSLEELQSNIFLLTVIGTEPVVVALSGISNYLIKTKQAWDNLAHEIRTTFPKSKKVTFDALAALPYLNAVIHEGLRLCPPFSGPLSRVVPQGGDTVCGMWLPEGTHVGIHQWSLYRSPSNFHNATSFVPERWLQSTLQDPHSSYRNDQRHVVQPFCTGPWACPGKELGLSLLRLILARLVWDFDMSVPSNGKTVDWASQKQYLSVEVEEGFYVRLAARASWW